MEPLRMKGKRAVRELNCHFIFVRALTARDDEIRSIECHLSGTVKRSGKCLIFAALRLENDSALEGCAKVAVDFLRPKQRK